MILEGNPPRALRRRRPGTGDHSELVAIARGHRSEDWLGLAAIWTRPDHRARRGKGDDDCTRTLGGSPGRALCVHPGGDCQRAGLAAYGRLGFVHHHGYVYLAPAR